MKLPKQNELIRVFNDHYPEGKLRYFKEKSPDPKSPISVYADGHTKETNGCLLEYWDRWEYPKLPFSTCRFSIYDSLEDAEMGKISNFKLYKKSIEDIKKCSCLTDPEKRNIKKIKNNIAMVSGDLSTPLPESFQEKNFNTKIEKKSNKTNICSNVLDIKETENNISGDISDMPLEAPKYDSEEGKPDLNLIPYDLINEMLLPAYEEGLQKYYRDSWRLGFPVLKMCAAMLRHLFAFMFKHEDYDPVAKEKYNIKKHHLGAVMFCCISIYNSLKINPDRFDDRTNFKKKGE